MKNIINKDTLGTIYCIISPRGDVGVQTISNSQDSSWSKAFASNWCPSGKNLARMHGYECVVIDISYVRVA